MITFIREENHLALPNHGFTHGCYSVIKNCTIARFEFDQGQQRQAFTQFCNFVNQRDDRHLLYFQFQSLTT